MLTKAFYPLFKCTSAFLLHRSNRKFGRCPSSRRALYQCLWSTLLIIWCKSLQEVRIGCSCSLSCAFHTCLIPPAQVRWKCWMRLKQRFLLLNNSVSQLSAGKFKLICMSSVSFYHSNSSYIHLQPQMGSHMQMKQLPTVHKTHTHNFREALKGKMPVFSTVLWVVHPSFPALCFACAPAAPQWCVAFQVSPLSAHIQQRATLLS